jgi:hypothetical protein
MLVSCDKAQDGGATSGTVEVAYALCCLLGFTEPLANIVDGGHVRICVALNLATVRWVGSPADEITTVSSCIRSPACCT